MLLKIGGVYICLRDVKAFELGYIEVGHDNVARLSVTFYMLPKPLNLSIELGKELTQEDMVAAREQVGIKLAELVIEAKKGNTWRIVDASELTRVSDRRENA